MKTIYLGILFFVCIANSGFASTASDTSKSLKASLQAPEESDNAAIPDDYYLQSQELEDCKKRIEEIKISSDILQSYINAIDGYMESLRTFDSDGLKKKYEELKDIKVANSQAEDALKWIERESIKLEMREFYEQAAEGINPSVFSTKVFSMIRSIEINYRYFFDITKENPAAIRLYAKNKIDQFGTILNGVSDLKNACETEKRAVEAKIKELDLERKELSNKRAKILSKMNEKRDINSLAIKVGLPAFCITILLLFLGPAWIRRKSTNPDGDTTGNGQSVLLEISTVLLLTMSILILGLSGKINGDVLGTLIGGISGYVLNRMRNAPPAPETKKTNPS